MLANENYWKMICCGLNQAVFNLLYKKEESKEMLNAVVEMAVLAQDSGGDVSYKLKCLSEKIKCCGYKKPEEKKSPKDLRLEIREDIEKLNPLKIFINANHS